MSSVSFKKCHAGTAEASAMIQHMTRHDGFDRFTSYENPHIDPARRSENYIVGATDHSTDSAEIYQALQERVREVDRVLPPRRIRRDRVTMMTYTVAAPDGLNRAQERRFFQIAYRAIAEASGGFENVGPGFVHRDEIHAYRDAVTGTQTMSRAHMHVAGIPYVAGVGINGKQFETRDRMRNLNQVIDRECRRQLKINFLTGRTGRSGRDLEALKAASVEKAIETHTERLADILEQIEAYEHHLRDVQDHWNRERVNIQRDQELDIER